MLAALSLALAQLGDPRILRVLAKSVAITLVLFVVLGGSVGYALYRTLIDLGVAGETSGLIAVVALILPVWLLWRVLALAVLQFFADEVVQAVELKHYPAAAASARKLGRREELSVSLRGLWRALAFNLLALPVALVLLVTGIGPALVFWLVNAVLIGRELTELVSLRHGPPGKSALPLGAGQRLALGGLVTALLALPLVNLVAPLLGAAAATHLVHRKGSIAHAA